ncbi:MAG: hypothetical protein KKD17_01475, partial [Nanoarchaeota archaeon]|nr:hypothetical protein [Nanoarchaeota archaeon]
PACLNNRLTLLTSFFSFLMVEVPLHPLIRSSRAFEGYKHYGDFLQSRVKGAVKLSVMTPSELSAK